MSKSLIGKTYIPSDNSYCVNLSYPQRDHRLAGTHSPNRLPKQTKIVSEPYEFIIRTEIGELESRSHWFINVEYNGDINRVLYYNRNVGASLEDRLAHNRTIQEMFLK